MTNSGYCTIVAHRLSIEHIHVKTRSHCRRDGKAGRVVSLTLSLSVRDVSPLVGDRAIHVHGAVEPRGHEQASRPYELVDDAEDENADEHEHERRDDLGEGVESRLSVLPRWSRVRFAATAFPREASGQGGEGQTLREGELVQRLRQRVRPH